MKDIEFKFDDMWEFIDSKEDTSTVFKYGTIIELDVNHNNDTDEDALSGVVVKVNFAGRTVSKEIFTIIRVSDPNIGIGKGMISGIVWRPIVGHHMLDLY